MAHGVDVWAYRKAGILSMNGKEDQKMLSMEQKYPWLTCHRSQQFYDHRNEGTQKDHKPFSFGLSLRL